MKGTAKKVSADHGKILRDMPARIPLAFLLIKIQCLLGNGDIAGNNDISKNGLKDTKKT
jgi:hypothetical protein